MLDRARLENFHKIQCEINRQKAELNNEFQKFEKELYCRSLEVIRWKDQNLGNASLRFKWESRGKVHEIRPNCVVLRILDTDSELPAAYYNVLYDEIFSDDWKEIALIAYEQKKEQEAKAEQEKKEKMRAESEARELAEYKRLKAKFEQ